MHKHGSKALKIGYILQYDTTRVFPVSATARHVEAVVRGLEQRGHCVRTVALRNGIAHYSDNLKDWQPVAGDFKLKGPLRLVEKTVRGVQTRLKLPFFRLFDSYRFARACAVALEGYDLLYERFWLLSSGGAMAARRLKAPIFYEVNGDLVAEYAMLGIELPESQWSAIRRVTREMFGRAGRVIAVGQTIKQKVIERFQVDPRKVDVVTNGVEIDTFLEERDAAAIRRQLGLGDEPLVIFVGNFKPWHGVDLIVEAFSHLNRALPEVRLLMVGDGGLRAEAEAQVAALGIQDRVTFTGAVGHTEVGNLLCIADVAVIYQRGAAAEIVETPLKLFEYMAAGKAIVAPAMPNMERVLADRQTAMLAPPDNPQALADTLAEMLTDQALRARLGEAARQQAIERHSWARTVQELEAIFYQELEPQARTQPAVEKLSGKIHEH